MAATGEVFIMWLASRVVMTSLLMTSTYLVYAAVTKRLASASHSQVKTVPFFVNTGASVNVIDEQSFKSMNMNIELSPSSTTIYAYGTKESLHVLGQFTTDVTYKDTVTTATFHVVQPKPNAKGGNLLGPGTAENYAL